MDNSRRRQVESEDIEGIWVVLTLGLVEGFPEMMGLLEDGFLELGLADTVVEGSVVEVVEGAAEGSRVLGFLEGKALLGVEGALEGITLLSVEGALEGITLLEVEGALEGITLLGVEVVGLAEGAAEGN